MPIRILFAASKWFLLARFVAGSSFLKAMSSLIAERVFHSHRAVKQIKYQGQSLRLYLEEGALQTWPGRDSLPLICSGIRWYDVSQCEGMSPQLFYRQVYEDQFGYFKTRRDSASHLAVD
jgi:hypothetical protein